MLPLPRRGATHRGLGHVCPACAGHRAIVGVCHGLVLQAAEYRHRYQFRGRSLTTEIFPFSFREFLLFHQAEPESPQRFGSATRAVLQHQSGAYLTTGGFPEVQGLDAELRRQVLRNYVDVVILRDVVERYSISNVVALRALIRHIMSAPATRFSVNKFYQALRSQGVACTKNDLYAFLEYLTDAFLVYTAPTHARSEHVRRVNPKKVYAIDTGLLGAMAFHTRRTAAHCWKTSCICISGGRAWCLSTTSRRRVRS